MIDTKIMISIPDKEITDLAGDNLGKKIYEEQVSHVIDFSKANVIVFPEQIEDLAISFVHGFCRKILKRISKKDFRKIIIVEFSTPHLIEMFYENMEF